MPSSKANIAYKYRLYPILWQTMLFVKTFGCCRKIWNLMLSDKIDFYKSDGLYLYLTPAMYKDDYTYLKEVDSLALANVQLALERAYTAFFSNPKIGFPNFKSRRKTKSSYTTSLVSNNIEIGDNYIRLPKAGKVKAKIHRRAPEGYKLKSVTVSREKDGSFYASVLYEYSPSVDHSDKSVEISRIGLDYKSSGLYVDSNGSSAGMPHYYMDSQKRLKKLQKKLSHMIESHITGYKTENNKRCPVYDKPISECKNIQKMKRKIAKLHRHVANQRKDFLQKLSTERTNQYELVSVESLNMRSLANKGFGNGKATLDNGYGMFVDMLEYKQEQKGHYLIRVDKWFPSSQTCSCCGQVNPKVKDLSVRQWICPSCGIKHDRDVNAAINIKKEGFRLLLAG